MRKVPVSHLAKERRAGLEQAKQMLAMWVAVSLSGGESVGASFVASRVAYWDDYIKQREKEMEDGEAT